MKRLTLFLSAAITLALLLPIAADDLSNLNKDLWMGIYHDKEKIGYQHSTVVITTFEGRKVYRYKVESSYRSQVGGVDARIDTSSTQFIDSTFRPLYEVQEQVYDTPLGKRCSTAKIWYRTGVIDFLLDKDGEESRLSIPSPPVDRLRNSCKLDLGVTHLEVGKPINYSYYDETERKTVNGTMVARKMQTITIGGKKLQANAIISRNGSGETIRWQDKNGDCVKVEWPQDKITMIREPKSMALSGWDTKVGAEQEKIDLKELRIDSNKQIRNPTKVSSLRLQLVGTKRTDPLLNDDRQSGKMFYNGIIEYQISVRSFNPLMSKHLPVRDSAYSKWLGATTGIEVENAAIRKQVDAIVGRESNAYKASCRIRAWVNDNVEYDMNSGTPLSAVEILSARKGDCKHFSVLYTALARAAGLPTRIVGGIVYSDNGFYGHAWVESHVGDWIALDPTSSEDFVDATHIKLWSDGLSPTRIPRISRVDILNFR